MPCWRMIHAVKAWPSWRSIQDAWGKTSPAERAVAIVLPRALAAGVAAHDSGADPVAATRRILDGERGLTVDYVAVANFDGPTLAAAIRVGGTRLIDNARLDAPTPAPPDASRVDNDMVREDA